MIRKKVNKDSHTRELNSIIEEIKLKADTATLREMTTLIAKRDAILNRI